ncbi:hypothetical protein AB0885_43530, partial [Streptomyces sp. NPDC005534]
EKEKGVTYPSLYDPTGRLMLRFKKGTLNPQTSPRTVGSLWPTGSAPDLACSEIWARTCSYGAAPSAMWIFRVTRRLSRTPGKMRGIRTRPPRSVRCHDTDRP